MDRRTDIVAKLEEGLEETVSFFSSLTAKELSVSVYHEEVSWTARQVLAHFITIERSMHWLFRNILSGGPGTPDDFDIQRFNSTQPQKLDGFSLDELIEQFETVRRETIAIVREASDADLDREGRHPFHGHGRLERFIRWAYEHARRHEDDVRRALDR